MDASCRRQLHAHDSARGFMGCHCLQATTQALHPSALLRLLSVSCSVTLLRNLQL